MKPLLIQNISPLNASRQRGVVLFFTLIALLALSLAAVALIRSVDTSTMIAGNLAFKQSTTSSANLGVEAATTWLALVNDNNPTLSSRDNPAHPFNVTGGALTVTGNFQNPGYFSNADPAVSLTDGTGIVWDGSDSCGLGANCADQTDAYGNTVRYVIQRMCLDANTAIDSTECLFSDAVEDTGGQEIKNYQTECSDCSVSLPPTQIRITARSVGPKNSISYVQAFVY